jgi:hypothetical protein
MRWLSMILVGAACASTNQFTRPEELEEIARAPILKPPPEQKIAHVEQWKLEGPLPERIEHTALADASKPFARILAAAASQARFQPSQDLTCVAQQLARFELENDASPGVLLLRFIEARCGVPSPAVRTSSLFGEADAEITDEKIEAQWKIDFEKQLQQVSPGSFAGVALVRAKGKVRLVLAWALDEARIEPVSVYPDNDVVRVRGVIDHPVEEISAQINQGTDATADCIKNPEVKAPSFEFACPVQQGDPYDWLGVWAREPGRFISHPVLMTLVWPDRAPTDTFRRPSIGLSRDGSAEAFLESLNEQRKKLGRERVTLAPKQSDQVSALVAPYVAAELDGNGPLVDRIAMGLIAGWRVEGPVTNGWFTSYEVPNAAASELLSVLLELPGARSELLSKETQVVALGVSTRGGLTDSLVCTYGLLNEPQPTEDRQQQLIHQLNAERKRRGLPAAQWVQLPTAVEKEVAASVRSGSMAPDDGLEKLMIEANQLIHRGVRGWQFTASSLDKVKWPDELLERPTLQVMMTIAPWKRKDLPWTQYVFMVVLFEGASTQA